MKNVAAKISSFREHFFLKFHSIGGLGKRLREEMYKTVTIPWKDAGIKVLIHKDSYRDYRAFPIL